MPRGLKNLPRRERRPKASGGKLNKGFPAMRKFCVLLSIILFAAFFIFQNAVSATITFDAKFGDGGKVITSFYGRADRVEALALQPDGKIVAAGWATGNDTSRDFALTRYLANGSLDSSFGSNGKVTTVFGAGDDQISAVALQADGKIVVAGRAFTGAGFDSALARYNPDGSLDTTFDSDGKLIIDFGYSDYASGLVLQSDGKIIFAGRALNSLGYSDIAIARLNGDGSLNSGFGNGGIVTTDFFGFHDVANCVALQSDGRIVVAGYAQTIAHDSDRFNDYAVARYHADGSLDSSFDSDGKVTTDFFALGDGVRALVLQAGGKIVVNGTVERTAGSYDFGLARYHSNGSLDSSFGTGGKVNTDLRGNFDFGLALTVQPDNKIIAAGDAGGHMALARFHVDGSLDTSFSPDGKITSNTIRGAYAVALKTDGKIIAAGQDINGFGGFGLLRFLAANSPAAKPSDFDGDGKSDIAVFRPSTGTWAILQSSDDSYREQQWGTAGDVAVPGDYDADGKTDLAVYRPGDGAWYILKSSDGGIITYLFGFNTDIPVPADYDGDNKTDVAVFRPANGTWYMYESSNNSFQARQWGNNQDWPVPGDYDEDGKANLAVFRSGNGTWYINSETFPEQVLFGFNSDKAVQADYDGDGKTDKSIYRPSNGTWYVWQSATNSLRAQSWGLSTDRPAQGDFDGDNKIDFAVWRPSTSVWYILRSSDNQFVVRQFGVSGDVPLTSAYVP